jgi:hypothetical protein
LFEDSDEIQASPIYSGDTEKYFPTINTMATHKFSPEFDPMDRDIYLHYEEVGFGVERITIDDSYIFSDSR